MEVYPRSSWFLLLLGFVFIAATLQETDCPKPAEVSCTSGTKCSSNEDCLTSELCCSNACYTKRCIPTSKGVQGKAETDGPSETDCRPYIEKALKELEIGEAGHAQIQPSDKDESAEDIPTIEITDDSSHQEEDGGQREASEESEAEEEGEQSKESLEKAEAQQEAAKGNTEDDNSKEDSGETPDEKDEAMSEEKHESDEDTKAEPSKEESVEEPEQAEQASAEDEQESKEQEIQQEFPDTASAESQEEAEAQIVKRDVPLETIKAIPIQETADSKEEDQSSEDEQQPSEKQKDESQEDDLEQQESKKDTVVAVQSAEESAEDQKGNDETADQKSDEDETKTSKKEAAEKSHEDDKSEEKNTVSTESTEGGCPDPSQVSCTEGKICGKHKHCGENKICCPNKCYRKRCIEGTVTNAELEAESESEESQEDVKSKEKTTSTTPDTGCPSPNEVSCTEGELCNKHKQCGENKICCRNKCYRKRCISGTATSAELEAESDEEESKEDSKEEIGKHASAEKSPETGCPSPNAVSCTEGAICSKHKECDSGTICCRNKCYRKRCTPGTPTDEELAAESDEDSKEEETKSEEVKTVPKIETGCPTPSGVSCTEGELCNKHRQCGDEKICCPNKCYRKRCIPGKATSAELEAESDEDSMEDVKDKVVSKEAPRKTSDTGCPGRDEVPCGGEICSKNKNCDTGEICCANKCYRKRCIPGKATSAELEAEFDEDSTEDVKDKVASKEAPRKTSDTGCPGRDEVPCGGEICSKNKNCDTGEICCANKCYRKVCVRGTPGSEEVEEESEEDATREKSAEAKATSAESQEDEGDCPSPEKVSCTEGQKCSDDDDCATNDVCCPNKCYTKRCVAGPEGGEESSEEEKPTVEIAPQPTKQEVREEVIVKAAQPSPPPPSPEPKREALKPEDKKPEIKKPEVQKTIVKEPELPKKPEVKKVEIKPPSKPVKVVEPIVEDESLESLETLGGAPVEELSFDTDTPTNLRPREHVEHLLKLDKESTRLEQVQNKVYEETLKELKKLYEHAIKPLETLYKYRDLSNRHFGDAEIFAKPLILFMGPWSGGKSSIINYLINNEYNDTALRTGAEPSPAYFNILTHGDEPDVVDGTELAADFTFSGLQKFGQGLEERLRGVKLPSKLLEKVNIVEIPGILEVRKQVSRVFPFNDACQWFIDRADIIFLVYDPSKLDVGPETEAILDQLKGREHQTRIILNKADQVKPEELMRVQGALIWNISPLMSSPQPPVMYTTSLWSRSYEPWAPVRLLHAQERSFLRDLRTAIDRRVENKIASARRFAVRVRNHAKMVDCYLTTYYNHKSVFGNRKQVANEIIEHPQDYHIYEGLSTLTNISRYDLPDPDVYREFFKLNPLYEFQQLSATCTYFRGCPINRLDIAIAYDLPELVGKYKRNLEEAISNANNPPKEPPPTKKTKKSAPGS